MHERPPSWLTLFRWALYLLDFVLLWILIPSIRKRLGATRKTIWSYSPRASAVALAIFQIRLHIEGTENLPRGRNAIYVCNHRSWFDQIVLCVALPHRLHFLSKEAYFRTPVLGIAMRLYEHIPVRPGKRGPLDSKSREHIFRALTTDGNLVFYPEGTRARSPELLPFKSGAFRYAAEAGVPVVPIHLLGLERILPRKANPLSIRGGPVRVVIGQPVQVDAKDIEKSRDRFEGRYRLEHARLTGRMSPPRNTSE